MNYEDEDYVRYYTRDTVSWRALGWEGQTVLALMLHGKFDRAGVFDCDGHDPSQAVTLVTGVPEHVTTVGLERLLKSRTWVLRDGKLVWPKFVHAQSCRRSDRARQRESRDKRRGDALGENVTDVTSSHSESQPVTPSLAKPSLAEDPPKPPKGRKRRPVLPELPIPNPFVPTDKHRAFCAQHGLDLDLEVVGLVAWAEGRTAASWNGTFTTRLVNAVKWRKERGGGHQQTLSVAAPNPDEIARRRASALAAEQRAEAQRIARLAQRGPLAAPPASDLGAGRPERRSEPPPAPARLQ